MRHGDHPDILLVNPYFVTMERLAPKDLDLYPPVGLLYLASSLRRAGFHAAILDGTFSTLPALLSDARASSAPIVGVTANLITRTEALRVAEEASARGALVIAGGPDPSTSPEKYFQAGVDAVLQGEGEETLVQLLASIHRPPHDDNRAIPGVVWPRPEPEVRPRPLIEDLGSLSWPDFTLVDVNRYLAFNKTYRGFSILPILSARGCPFKCSWCSKPVFGDSFRARPVREFVDELVT